MTQIQITHNGIVEFWENVEKIVLSELIGKRILKMPELCHEIKELVIIFEKTGRSAILFEIDYRLDNLSVSLKKALITKKINEEQYAYLYATLKKFRIYLNRKAA